MTINEYIKEVVKLNLEGTFSSDDDCYVIDIYDSDEFAAVESILEKRDFLEEDDDLSQIDEDSEYVVFYDDENGYQLSLIGDFDDDSYRLVVKELD